jgi:hypothetical protein
MGRAEKGKQTLRNTVEVAQLGPGFLESWQWVLGKGMINRTSEYSSVALSVKKSQCCMEPEGSLQHGCINTGHPVARATKFFAVVPNIFHVLAAYFF